ncbi:MAG: CoA ester lyase [Nocardiopsaceae bacterium]|nr:CoA ester lyase [Nocardiopsaceae bacterium]
MSTMRLRSPLFAPANRPDLVAKTPRSGPDAVIIDLEDGTPPDAKMAARGQAATVAQDLLDNGYSGLILLRVNAPDAVDLFEDDLRAYAAGPFGGVVVPKTETAAQVRDVEARLRDLGTPGQGGAGQGGTGQDGAGHRVIWGIESARGVVEAVPALAASELGVAAYFGAEDYIADLGGRRTARGTETFYARTQLAMACRLAGLVAIDQVVTAIRDAARFEADAQFALDVGFGGKMCVHPSQVEICHALFTPPPEAVERARRLLACYERALREGRATANFEGQMIDGPLVAQARQVLDRACG